MLYHYSAVENSGKIAEGDYEGNDLEQVLQHLRGQGLRPISVLPVQEKRGGAFGFWKGSISITDKVFLTKYLALMLRVGTDLLSAVNILIADFDKPAVRDFLLELRTNLTSGQPFWQAFAKHPRTFSLTFVNLVKAAEVSGNLQETFEELSRTTERDAALQGSIRSALIYPIVLVVAAVGILTFLVTFALPKIANVFSQSGIQPPVFSRVVFGIGLFIGGNIVVFLSIFIGGGLGLLFFVLKTETGKRAFQRVLTSLPVIKNIYQELAMQRMASTMASLMKAGLPILQTIQIAADTVGYREYQYALLRIANDGLSKGLTIGEAFRRETVFPKTVTNLVAISEEAGHLEEVLSTLADFYGANIDGSIKGLMSLLEPVLLLLMGIMVAVIALSIIVPIYQLTTQF
jgi:type IV pilus assembly protein PilC